MRELAKQRIVITGASSGIGLETARRAVRAGAQVLFVSRNADALQRILTELNALGGKADFLAADVGDPVAVNEVARRASERFGGIDTWINCAGVAIYGDLISTPFDEHERLFRTNYFGVVNCAQAALPYLEGSSGALITVGSIASDIPTSVLGAYAASKHAVKGFIESLRIELSLRRSPVSICLVKPSGVDTPIGQNAANHLGAEALIPPPVYDPTIVAEAILRMVEHPRREVTVGGIGRINVLLGEHFPRALEWLSRYFAPLLSDRRRPPTPSNNLDVPGVDGRVRSGTEHGRQFSFYAALGQPRVKATLLAGGAGAFALVAGRWLWSQRAATRRTGAASTQL